METLISRLKAIINTDLSDAQLGIYLEDALSYVVDFTHQEEAYVLEKLKGQIVKVAISWISKRGAEGLKSQSFSGASETYEDDVDEAIKRSLRAHRRTP